MKVERLYAITVFLMNHGRTSAKDLVKHFGVSPVQFKGTLIHYVPLVFLLLQLPVKPADMN